MAKIPADKMIACWATDDLRITKLVVVHIDNQTSETNKLYGRAGASDAGWMGDIMDTPLGLFTYLATAYGFATREVAKIALGEFAKVDQTPWVQTLQDRAGF
jgi:hypothetical protein